MIRSLATGRRVFSRLLLAAAFLAALLVATPAHTHSSVGSEAACAACTFSHQPTSLEIASLVIDCDSALQAKARPVEELDAEAGFESPSRPRSPPFSS